MLLLLIFVHHFHVIYVYVIYKINYSIKDIHLLKISVEIKYLIYNFDDFYINIDVTRFKEY